ncbi:MAG: hypothetical protein D6674_00775 [Acidobacteria bacterium]|jgi:flagellar motor switch protein FliM|nr:MAG: hypothetical protein D6674_00775 [Acidobacteriota bacterium]
MADEFLSQEEVNLLLQTLGKEKGKAQEVVEEKVKPLDRSLFEHISAGRIPGLELVFERWVTGLRKNLTSVVAIVPNVIKESTNIVKFSEFSVKLPVPCAIGIFNIEPLRGTCLISLDPKLIYVVVSNVFGGSVKPYKIEGKEFTRIEIKIIQRILNVCYQELENAWGSIMNARVNPIGIETNPALLTMARPRERFILLKVTVILDGNEGQIQLAIPEEAIAPYKELLKGATEMKTRDIEFNTVEAFKKVPVKLEVVLGRGSITFGELLDLGQDSIILLDRQVKEPLDVLIEGVPKLKAFLGQVSRNKAFKVYRYLKKEDV